MSAKVGYIVLPKTVRGSVYRKIPVPKAPLKEKGTKTSEKTITIRQLACLCNLTNHGSHLT